MWTTLFVITTAVCAIGWFTRYISCAAMIYYIQKNQYKLPTDQDMKECADFVVKPLFS